MLSQLCAAPNRQGRVSGKKKSPLVLLVVAGKSARLRQMWASRVAGPLISERRVRALMNLESCLRDTRSRGRDGEANATRGLDDDGGARVGSATDRKDQGGRSFDAASGPARSRPGAIGASCAGAAARTSPIRSGPRRSSPGSTMLVRSMIRRSARPSCTAQSCIPPTRWLR
jgi:hypothetical protein